MLRRPCSFAALLVLLSGVVLTAAPLRADEIDSIASEVMVIQDQASTLESRYLKNSNYRSAQYVAERLIDGENFYRTKDYQRAAIIFMDIIENHRSNAAYPDALFLYADSLFLARDYLGARDWFRKVLETRATGIKRFRQKAIERLIEIAIHLGDYKGVDEYFTQLGQIPTPEAKYVKGKYLYFRGDLDAARQMLGTVSDDLLIELKALYMIGVILTRQGKYKEAIEVFLRGRDRTTSTGEEREIVDLLNLGAGRLYYEQGFVEHASECYQRIEDNSPYFDTALFEAATVLIRAGDTIRAEQTLEVLTVAMPDSRYIPRAKMLRGNLLLRTGRYDDAERVFDELIDEFTPVMNQLEQVIQEQQDTRQFFFELVERSAETLDVSTVLPPLVVKWVEEEREVQRALELAADLGTAKENVRETERLVRLLEAVIDGPSRINAIPMLREAIRRSQQLNNRLGQLRGRLIEIAQENYAHDSGELGRLRDERRSLEGQLSALPTTNAAFEKREKDSRKIYNRMRHELSRNLIRLDQLSAKVVAIESFISDPRYTDGVSAKNVKTVQEELKRHREAIRRMNKDVTRLKNDVDSARYQVGVGDSRDRKDAELRRRIRKLAREERRLLGSRAGKVGGRLEKVHRSIDNVEGVVVRFERGVAQEATRKVESMKQQVRTEREHVTDYHAELRLLDTEAEEVVGGVAFENFSTVRKRFHDLVLKADVGIIDVAWLRKEEHTSRINDLTKGRLNDIKILDEEFQEVKSGGESQAR